MVAAERWDTALVLYRPKAYKHPVLALSSSDYLPGPRFDCDFIIGEDSASLGVSFSLSNPYFDVLLLEGKAEFGVEVLCTETISRRYFPFEQATGDLDLSVMDLFGHVEFAPLLVASTTMDDFTPEFKNPEYKQSVFSVRKGEPLAIGQVFDVEIQRDHHRTEAPFEIDVKSGKDPHYFELDTSLNSLRLSVSEEIGAAIQVVESDSSRSPLLYQGIYLTTVAIAVEKMRERIKKGDTSQFWVRRLLSILEEQGVDTSDSPTMVASQLLYSRGWKQVLSQQEVQK